MNYPIMTFKLASSSLAVDFGL